MTKHSTLSKIPPDASELTIDSHDWWVKVISMLCHNWALIGSDKNGRVTVYFFHDSPATDNARAQTRWIRVIDSLEFSSRANALCALRQNDFMELDGNRDASPYIDWGMQPIGRYYYPNPDAKGVYSSGEYWINRTE